jgi:hypothetical protein
MENLKTNLLIIDLQELYLDWVNNFLTISRFAEYYNITVIEAEILIEAGKKINEIK